VRWNRGGDDEGTCDLTALHDHGWGKNILPLRLPLKVFRYEVMGLPDGGFAIALWTEGPAGLELRNIGLIRPEGGPLAFMRAYSCQVLDWDTFENYEGQPCRVPRRWAGTLEGRTGRFVYETERETEPRPVLGEGFLYASRYCGHFQGKGLDQLGLAGKEVAGRGYVEHIARFAGRGN
jgi:hypothetical protein